MEIIEIEESDRIAIRPESSGYYDADWLALAVTAGGEQELIDGLGITEIIDGTQSD